MKSLTKRQLGVLETIYEMMTSGLPPTYAELRKKLGVSSNQTVKDFLNVLSKKEYIKQENRKARAIILTKKAYRELNKRAEYISDCNFIPIPTMNVSISNDGDSSSFSGREHFDNENIFYKIN